MVKDVHTEHCCVIHGCKYNNGDLCSVISGRKKQSFPCENCGGNEMSASLEKYKINYRCFLIMVFKDCVYYTHKYDGVTQTFSTYEMAMQTARDLAVENPGSRYYVIDVVGVAESQDVIITDFRKE